MKSSLVGTVYRWQGEVHEAAEARCMIRTRLTLVPAILDRVKLAHLYDVPSVVALPIAAANPDYADWIREQTPSHPEA